MVAIKACGNMWITAEKEGTGPLMNNRERPASSQEHFSMVQLSQTEVAFKACNDMYVSAEMKGERALAASA